MFFLVLKIGVLTNFVNFTGKHLCLSLFLIKLPEGSEGLQLYQKETLTQVLSCEICEIFKNTFFTEHLRWLLLEIQ